MIAAANVPLLSLGQADVRAMLPIAILAGSGVLALLLDVFVPKPGRRFTALTVGLIGTVAAAFFALHEYGRVDSVFGGMFTTGGFTVVIELIVLGATAISYSLSSALGRDDQIAGAVALIAWSATGALLLAGASDLTIVFLGIELLSLALYVLCAIAPGGSGHEAALKYLILSSTATGFMLFGMALLFGATGSTALSALLDAHGTGSLYTVGLGLFGIGIVFKLSLAPFHEWTPDVYEGAPLPVTAFMSIVTKVGVFAVLARLIYAALPPGSSSTLLTPLWIVAGLSMIVGNVGALAQTDMKRLLAYSGIAQVGYVVAALAGASPLGLRYAVFYLAGYTFMNLGAFAVVAVLTRRADDGSRLSAFTGLAQRQPALAVAMTIFLLGLTGLPPTVGFIGKLLILWTTVDARFVGLGVLLVIGSAISAYAYIKILRAMFGRSTGRGIERTAAGSHPLAWISVAACAIAVLVLGLYPRIPSDIIPILK